MNNDLPTASRFITFVIAYYGQWPSYWRLWAGSVAANSAVGFVIITDLPVPEPLPANVRLLTFTYDQTMQRLESVIGTQLPRHRYHKLCDYKPFYALAFPEAVLNSRYWGYCDMDLIWGDLSPLIHAATEGIADIISPWHFTVGHCCIVRNASRTNSLALHTSNLRSRLESPDITFIDEGAFSETALHLGGFKFHVVESLEAEWSLPHCFLGATIQPGGTISGLPGPFLITYDKGKVLVYDSRRQRHEVLYLHFMGMKQRRFWQKLPENMETGFSVTPFGIVPKLLPPKTVSSWRYRLKGNWAQLPSRAYSIVHRLTPSTVLKLLIRWRNGMLGNRR